MRVTLAAFLLFALGCDAPPNTCEPTPGGGAGGGANDAVAPVGQRATVELKHNAQVRCVRPLEVETVESKVTDPYGRDVEHQLGVPIVSNTNVITLSVTFTPFVAGVHQVTARFQPNFGTAQREVWANVERRFEAPQKLLLGACERTAREGNAAFCLAKDGKLNLAFDGVVFAAVPLPGRGGAVGDFVLSGETLWTVESTALARYTLTAGQLIEGPRLTGLCDAAGGRLYAATADSVIVLCGTDFHRVQHGGGQLLAASSLAWPGYQSSHESVQVGDWLLARGNSRVCARPLSSLDGGTCSTDSSGFLGIDDEGLWTWNVSQRTLRYYRAPLGEGLMRVATVDLPSNGSALSVPRWSGPMLKLQAFDGGIALPRYGDAGVYFERWPEAREVLRDFVRVERADAGEQWFYPR